MEVQVARHQDPKTNPCRICKQMGHCAKDCDQAKKLAAEELVLKWYSISSRPPPKFMLQPWLREGPSVVC